MTFRLRSIETTAGGRRIVRDRDVAGDSISVGRSADNGLHLPDLALDPRHATIARRADGLVSVESAGSLGFTLDGRVMLGGAIDPRTGGELRFGGYRIVVGLDDDGAVLLTVDEPGSDRKSADEPRFSLAGLLAGKRSMSWALALVVLAGFLAVPIFSALTRDPMDKSRHVTGDAAWSTGPLSLAHSSLGDRCEACHVKPFEAVRDAACLSCHQDVHDHAPPMRLGAARGSGNLGDRFLWRIAHQFGKPGPGACSDCHTEHESAARMAPPGQAFCAECHGSLKDRLPDTGLGDAADFGKRHPEFRPAIPLTAGSPALTRVSLAVHPREAGGLTFPHRLHLEKRGGVAQMAARIGAEQGFGGNGLGCKDCHRSTPDGVRFQPIDMERDCQSCHSLAYDRVGGIVRRLRHGDVDQMVADLAAAPSVRAPIVGGRSRPGQFANGGVYFARFVPAAGGAGLVERALSRDGICGECHTPSAVGGRFSVVPVAQVSRFFDHGWFSHAAHKQEQCASCHGVERSQSAGDLLLPGIKTCRTCHQGEDAAAPKVPSGCAMCHNYHVSGQAPRGLDPRAMP